MKNALASGANSRITADEKQCERCEGILPQPERTLNMMEMVLTGAAVLLGVWGALTVLFVLSYRTSERTPDA